MFEGNIYLSGLIIFLATLIAGSIVFIRKWSDEHLHFFISFGAGIFLGIVFLHLLPESIEESAEGSGWFILCGFLLLFFIERFLFSRGDGSYHHSHHAIGITAFIGLTIHSIIDGVGLAGTIDNEKIGSVIFMSVIAHKVPAAIALSSLLVIARLSVKKTLSLLGIFALMTPVVAIFSSFLFINAEDINLGFLPLLVTGSFLYIATAELLPEVFHGNQRRWVNLILLLAGIVIVGVI